MFVGVTPSGVLSLTSYSPRPPLDRRDSRMLLPAPSNGLLLARGYKGSHDSQRVEVENACDFNALHDVQPAFTTLVFGNKGLRTVQPLCDLGLGEATGATGIGENSSECVVCLTEGRFRHPEPPISRGPMLEPESG